MNALAALAAGALVGLASFGGLWLTVRRLPKSAECGMRNAEWKTRLRLAASQRRPPSVFGIPHSALRIGTTLGRLALVGVAFAVLARSGPGAVLAGLAGLWLARWWLVWRIGGSNGT